MAIGLDIEGLLSAPEELLKKRPFTRGGSYSSYDGAGVGIGYVSRVGCGERLAVKLPRMRRDVITQGEYACELDESCHKVLFDENIPKISQKLKDGSMVEIEYSRMSVPYQKRILAKKVLHLCGNPILHNMLDSRPSDKMQDDFVTFKQWWEMRNQEGMKTKLVTAAMSYGDAGLLYYMSRDGEIKSRLISYADGYVIISHDDDNGDRLMECLYYTKDGIEYLDCYDSTYMTRFRRDGETMALLKGDNGGWVRGDSLPHGFSEIPLITKRTKVAWDAVQSLIEVYEVIYNIFLVIQKRHGWGILYVKGKFADKGQKIAGAIVLNDTSLDGNGSAEFKTPPSPQQMIDTLGLLEETIQKGSGTTFLLPKDVKVSGDISGVAIMLTQSMDIETALAGVIEWQNVADKMTRLFKEGLAKELVMKGIQPTAITDFEKLKMSAKFQIWRPKSESELVTNLSALRGAKLISQKTGIEASPFSMPDEVLRCEIEAEKERESELQAALVAASANSAAREEEEEDENEEGIENHVDNKLK